MPQYGMLFSIQKFFFYLTHGVVAQVRCFGKEVINYDGRDRDALHF